MVKICRDKAASLIQREVEIYGRLNKFRNTGHAGETLVRTMEDSFILEEKYYALIHKPLTIPL